MILALTPQRFFILSCLTTILCGTSPAEPLTVRLSSERRDAETIAGMRNELDSAADSTDFFRLLRENRGRDTTLVESGSGSSRQIIGYVFANKSTSEFKLLGLGLPAKDPLRKQALEALMEHMFQRLRPNGKAQIRFRIPAANTELSDDFRKLGFKAVLQSESPVNAAKDKLTLGFSIWDRPTAPMLLEMDFYERLGVSAEATQQELDTALKKRELVYANENPSLDLIRAAHTFLSNPEMRARHDGAYHSLHVPKRPPVTPFVLEQTDSIGPLFTPRLTSDSPSHVLGVPENASLDKVDAAARDLLDQTGWSAQERYRFRKAHVILSHLKSGDPKMLRLFSDNTNAYLGNTKAWNVADALLRAYDAEDLRGDPNDFRTFVTLNDPRPELGKSGQDNPLLKDTVEMPRPALASQATQTPTWQPEVYKTFETRLSDAETDWGGLRRPGFFEELRLYSGLRWAAASLVLGGVVANWFPSEYTDLMGYGPGRYLLLATTIPGVMYLAYSISQLPNRAHRLYLKARIALQPKTKSTTDCSNIGKFH